MRSKRSYLLVLVGLAAGLVPVACLPKPKTPIFLNSSFNQRGINEITVLPAVDLRQPEDLRQDEERLDGNEHVTRTLAAGLQRRNYSVAVVDDFGADAKPTTDDLSRPAPAWIEKLGPAKNRWLLLVSIVHVERHITVGVKYQADLQGYLFDKEKGELLWQGEGHGVGAMGFLLAGLAKGAALEDASADLMRSFPGGSDQRVRPEGGH